MTDIPCHFTERPCERGCCGKCELLEAVRDALEQGDDESALGSKTHKDSFLNKAVGLKS